jgi:hypothetical protein
MMRGGGRDALCAAARGMQAFAPGEINWLLVLLVVRLAVLLVVRLAVWH